MTIKLIGVIGILCLFIASLGIHNWNEQVIIRIIGIIGIICILIAFIGFLEWMDKKHGDKKLPAWIEGPAWWLIYSICVGYLLWAVISLWNGGELFFAFLTLLALGWVIIQLFEAHQNKKIMENKKEVKYWMITGYPQGKEPEEGGATQPPNSEKKLLN